MTYFVSNGSQAGAFLRETPLEGLQNRTPRHPEHGACSPNPLLRERDKGDAGLSLAEKKPAVAPEKRQKQRPGRGSSHPALELKSNLDGDRGGEMNVCARPYAACPLTIALPD